MTRMSQWIVWPIGIAIWLGAVTAAFLCGPAAAQNTDTYFYTPNGGGVNGAVGMCLNTSNKAVPCSAANVAPSPVTDYPGTYSPVAANTPGNLTLATGGTSQTLFAAGEIVHGCSIQNPPTATEPIAVNFTGAAATTTAPSSSMVLPVGYSIGCPGGLNLAVTWNAATTGHVINAYKW